MCYSKGPQKGQILSPYFQNKALSLIEDTDLHRKVQELDHKNKQLIRKAQSLGSITRHLKDQKKHHISTIRSLVQGSSTISPDVFRNHIKSLFKENKKQYSANTVWMATQMTQIGQSGSL